MKRRRWAKLPATIPAARVKPAVRLLAQPGLAPRVTLRGVPPKGGAS